MTLPEKKRSSISMIAGGIAYAFLFSTIAAPAGSAASEPQPIESLRQAAAANPRSVAIKRNLSGALAEQGGRALETKDTGLALKLFQEAVAVDPENGPAWLSLGDLYYMEHNSFRQAIEAWKKALPLAPPHIRRLLIDRISRAELDERLEKKHEGLESFRFQIRIPQGFNPQDAERILAYLENRYTELAEDLQVNPSKLTLIIYPAKAFERITGGHEGVLGLYDGKIRIGEREIGSALEGVILNHELAHAFLRHAYGNKLPVWIQEGYAQIKEPPRELSGEESRIERSLKEGLGWVPLKWLDRRFLQPASSEDVTRAYLQSKLVVSVLARQDEGQGFRDFLRRLADGEDVKEAFEKSFKGLSWNAVEHGRLPF